MRLRLSTLCFRPAGDRAIFSARKIFCKKSESGWNFFRPRACSGANVGDQAREYSEDTSEKAKITDSFQKKFASEPGN